ncbi:thiol:disulfide interchange protein DsbD [Filimonas sp.]|nr:thiol:disulfide interchange protein DsbD [Filimonas sp.]
MKKFLITLLCLALGSQFAFSEIIKDPTTWTFSAKKIKDAEYELTLHCKLKPEWHLWSLDPGGDGLLMPPSFTFEKNKSVQFVGKIKESGKVINKEFPGTDGITHYYENEITYRQKANIKYNTSIKGNVHYQTCDHSQCLAPKDKAFEIIITDAGTAFNSSDTGSSALASTAPVINTPVKAAVSAAGNTKKNEPAKIHASGHPAEDHRSNFMLLLEGMGGGLLAILTPCVFAMLPMTVSFFLKRTKDRKSGIKVALQYSISIIIIFALLGLLLTFVNNKNILYEISSHWVTNVFFFVIFIIFGVAFLGAFEITLPAKWSTFTDSKANLNSWSGIFFMALTLAIVSFSCTAPFIGGLIAEISKGAKIGPLFGFTGFGLGLALPFTLFAIFPQLLTALTKQGGWLNAVKVTFGFIELALAFKFLSNADLQMGWRLLDREIFIAIWFVIALALALYLLGMIRFSHDSDLPKNDWDLPYLTVTRLMFALTALVFAFYMLPGMWGAPLNGMGAFVPPMGTQDFVLTSGGGNIGGSTTEHHENNNRYAKDFVLYEPEVVKKNGMNTYFDYDDALKASKEQKKPIMLDFTGITCVNCRKMETQVWSNEEVFKRMKENFIVVSLFCDATNIPIPETEQYESQLLGSRVKSLGQKNIDIQSSKYNSNTQPNYFFIDENENLLADKEYSYNPSPEKFVAHLDAVLKRYAANSK